MTPETRSLLANTGASMLLAVAFFLFAAGTVAAFMAWRGLVAVRRELPRAMARTNGLVRHAGRITHDTADTVITPPIRLSAALSGIKAGARALAGGSAQATDDEGADAARQSQTAQDSAL